MHANQDNLPSVDAVFAAIKAAEIWDNGFPVSLTRCGKKLFACTENKNAVFIKDVATDRTASMVSTNAPGQNSTMALAMCIDVLLTMREVDYSLAAEQIFETLNRPNFITTIEECASFGCQGALFFGGGLDRFYLAVYVGALAYGFNEEDTWNFIKDGLRFNSKQSIHANVVDQLGQLHDWKTADHVGVGYYDYDPAREV